MKKQTDNNGEVLKAGDRVRCATGQRWIIKRDEKSNLVAWYLGVTCKIQRLKSTRGPIIKL